MHTGQTVRQPRFWLWLVCVFAATALGAAVARLAQIPVPSVFGVRDARPELRQLVSALANEPMRPVEGRLTGGFTYAPPPSPARAVRTREASSDVRLAAVALEKAAEQRPTPEIDAALGVAYLAVNDIDNAVAHLEAAVAAQPKDGYFQNDLATAYLARARARDRAEDLPRALSAAEHALAAAPTLKETKFNRALALEYLGLRAAAAAAWERYLIDDASSGWANEAASRLQQLKSVHHVYHAPDLSEVPECVQHLSALLEAGLVSELGDRASECRVTSGHDAQGWLTYFVAVGDYYRGKIVESEARARQALESPHSPAVRGRLLYLVAGDNFAQGAFAPALALLEQAEAELSKGGDLKDLAATYVMTGDVLRALGERERAWKYYFRALPLMEDAPASIRRHALLTTLAIAGLTQGYPFFSINVLNLAEQNASGPSRAAQLGEVHLHRARAWLQLGHERRAFEDLDAAEVQVVQLSDHRTQTRLVADLAAGRSEILLEHAPDDALKSAAQSIEYYSRLGLVFKEAAAHLMAARAEKKRGRPEFARTQLLRGIELVEGERARLDEQRLRISHLDRVWELYRDYVELAITDGKDSDALAMLERARARATTGQSPSSDPIALRARLSADTAVVIFFQSDNWIARWTVTRDTVRFSRRMIPAAQLTRHVTELRQTAFAPNQRPSLEASSTLGRDLLADLSSDLDGVQRIVIVPDGMLGNVPFSMLRFPDTGAQVVERASVAVAPSLALHIRSELALRTRSGERSVAAVVPPNRPEFELPPLPGAGREAHAIAPLYTRSQVIEGSDATSARLNEVLRSASVVHFAGHAIADLDDPWHSRLIVAASAEDRRGAWMAESSTPGIHAIAVLAACSTAAGQIKRGEGIVSLAGLLLGSGAPAVIATLSDIDDSGSTEFFERVHRGLSQGQRPSDAVRAAQLEASRRSWRHWPSIVALGS